MPRLRLNLPGTGVPWTKVPNALIDALMPDLRDTELRVVLVLLRGTVGYNRSGRQVLLTYRRLMLLTGRKKEALANALASLEDRGLVHTQGSRRVPLSGAGRPGNRTATNKDRE